MTLLDLLYLWKITISLEVHDAKDFFHHLRAMLSAGRTAISGESVGTTKLGTTKAPSAMPTAADRIVGTWKHRDGFSEVEFSFSAEGGDIAVTVIDKFDDETPEIYDVAWNEDELVLRFAALWSTGRFVKYRVAVGPDPERIQATITSTSQELWERQ